MKQSCLFLMLCLFHISLSLSSVLAQTCMDNGNFRPNSTYDTNRQLILSSLPSNVTAENGFFYNGSIGQEPNRVYAIGMCPPESTSDDCFECIKKTSDEFIQNCPNQTDAYSWPRDRPLCLVRYSNTSFSGSADLDPYTILCNTGDVDSNLTEFRAIWEGLMGRMIAAASASRSTPSSTDNHYTADIAALKPILNIYASMHCTPDLSTRDCENCLRQRVIVYQSCCGLKQGAVLMRPSCFFRWELYSFSKAFKNIRVVSPPPLQPSPVEDHANTTDNGNGQISRGATVAIVVPTLVVLFIIIILVLLVRRGSVHCWRRKPYQQTDLDQSGIPTVHSLQMDFKTIEAATEKFTRSNKLGQGGFGEVFKGTLPNGTEVAVKRLSQASSQGTEEFKNEVAVIAKLHHRNLVRLLGFCLDGEEKILVYEFVPNKSLDYFLFDHRKKGQLDWQKRYNIIGGITRGILYLHQDSRLTIIHRDLKASNILLDVDMNPKIADFGMARVFGMDQSRANTNRIAGTRGYMPPEYVMHGQFSTKSDVYSFGVLVLEIISGQNNRFVHQPDTTVENLVTYAWRLWRNGTPLELVDPAILKRCQRNEVTRCIHIALLCVEKYPTARPNFSTIILMLSSNSFTLPVPHPPGFFFPNRRNQERDRLDSSQSTITSISQTTINDVTITELDPR